MVRASKSWGNVEREKHKRRERRLAAATVADSLGGVKTISISVTFKDALEGSDPRSEEHIFTPASRAFFEFQCRHWSCVEGGFDLNSRVEQAIKAKRKKVSGVLQCRGVQSTSESKETCPLSAHYEIRAVYG